MEKIRNNGEICTECKINLHRYFTKLKNRSMIPVYMCNDTAWYCVIRPKRDIILYYIICAYMHENSVVLQKQRLGEEHGRKSKSSAWFVAG